MLIPSTVGLLAAAAAAPITAPLPWEDPIDLAILYVGNEGTPRAQAFEEFLSSHFASVQVAERTTFDPAAADGFDVVLLDWSQMDKDVNLMGGTPPHSPLGPRDSWTTPTVLLGSAGLIMTGPWEIAGSYG
jgi:hypothetical protein